VTAASPAGSRQPRRGPLAWLALLARGVAMGIAELVPGVSGGTIAFVSGIYEELVTTLARLRPGGLVMLVREGPAAVWREFNLGFLAALAGGMVLAVVTFARVFEYLLDHAPTLVWAFFFGIIAASVVQIGRFRSWRPLLGYGLAGLLVALAVLQLGHRQGTAPLWMFFLGGMVAVSAWLLPAVSGSFLLLVLGLYEPVLRAFNAGEWLVPAALAAGCAVGLLAFSRALHWLMQRRREPVLCGLTVFMAGSLWRLWPWQAEGAVLSPAGYEAVTGQPALLPGALLTLALGVFALWLLSRLE